MRHRNRLRHRIIYAIDDGSNVSRLRQLSDVPAAVAERLFAWRLYGPHPYGHSSLGSESALSPTALIAAAVNV